MSAYLPAIAGILVAALTTGVVRVVMGWRPPGGGLRWTRTNHAGAPVSLLEGPAVGLGLIVGASVGALMAGHSLVAAAAVIAGATGLGFGLLDDLAEDMTSRRKGLRGHLGALLHGELTTGGAKVLGIGVGALVAGVLLPVAGNPFWLQLVNHVGAGALIAVSANLMNLLDLRPGRTLKAALLHVPFLVLFGGPAGAVGGAVLGAAAVAAPADLRGRDMLGDAGANAIGAVLAVGIVVVAPVPVMWAVLLVEVALTLVSEKVSFTAVIERTPVLREIDRWGRRR